MSDSPAAATARIKRGSINDYTEEGEPRGDILARVRETMLILADPVKEVILSDEPEFDAVHLPLAVDFTDYSFLATMDRTVREAATHRNQRN